MTNREAMEYAAQHSFLELYNKGKFDGRDEAVLKQANHDLAVKEAYNAGGDDRELQLVATLYRLCNQYNTKEVWAMYQEFLMDILK